MLAALVVAAGLVGAFGERAQFSVASVDSAVKIAKAGMMPRASYPGQRTMVIPRYRVGHDKPARTRLGSRCSRRSWWG